MAVERGGLHFVRRVTLWDWDRSRCEGGILCDGVGCAGGGKTIALKARERGLFSASGAKPKLCPRQRHVALQSDMTFFARPLQYGRSSFVAEHQREARSLFRAVLRECTYLPDARARTCLAETASWRFRNAQAAARLDLSVAADPNQTPQTRRNAAENLEQRICKGYKGLRALQRANEGELRPLSKVLFYTYGRAGRRKHQLFRALLLPDAVVSDSLSFEEYMKGLQESRQPMKWDLTTVPVPDIFDTPVIKGDFVEYSISDRYSKLKALVRSQVQTPPEVPSRQSSRIRTAVYKMPSKNIWGRSMPRRRAKNLVRKWYSLLIKRVLPPLPEHEWMRLQGLINGSIKWEGPVPRRARSLMKPEKLTTFDLEKLLRLTDRAGTLQTTNKQANDVITGIPDKATTLKDRSSSQMISLSNNSLNWLASSDLVSESLQDLLKDSMGTIRPLNKSLSGKDRGHRLTPRLMRRLWTRVFVLCPLLTKAEGESGWTVTWGAAPKVYNDPTSSNAFLPLFQTPQSEAIVNPKPQRQSDAI